MPFVPHSFEPYNADEEPAITIDKFGRLFINAAMRKKLGFPAGQPFKMHVAFETETGNIGVALPGDVNVPDTVAPANFDKRSYASARSFIKKHNVKVGKYVYFDRKHGWYSFRLADAVNP
ncbi:hypothetical protein G3578_09935 [Brevibacillus sp. SYP-B805]|uniref:hypothetical protein n=1 Tax=Brevibacillus sp. SYP-B805 TaxID=1578199 RepID=UPI0013EDF2D7|nr:hypothetical protein [Brevibacillus sp. SYP-B805]NGQ95471.1 hypothetical protein [Brevibacillus sp. SYP-B805]